MASPGARHPDAKRLGLAALAIARLPRLIRLPWLRLARLLRRRLVELLGVALLAVLRLRPSRAAWADRVPVTQVRRQGVPTHSDRDVVRPTLAVRVMTDRHLFVLVLGRGGGP